MRQRALGVGGHVDVLHGGLVACETDLTGNGGGIGVIDGSGGGRCRSFFFGRFRSLAATAAGHEHRAGDCETQKYFLHCSYYFSFSGKTFIYCPALAPALARRRFSSSGVNWNM